jgi:phosphohistidine swiveling domain-containing protein
MTGARSIDTAPHPEFRCYSAGNFAEVAPPRWSVMSWSLVGDPVERGLRAFTTRLLPTARWATGSYYVFVGYFSCRPYHNLAALCHLAHELPGFDGADVTRDYFENVPPPTRELRAHTSALQRVLAVPRMAREFHRLRPRLSELEADVTLSEEQVAAALDGGSPIALGGAMERALDMLDRAWDVHYSTTSSLVPASAIQRRLGRRLLPEWDELEPLVNRPNELPWNRLFDGAVSETGEESRFLRSPFYEVADGFEPWSAFASPFTPQPALDVKGPEQDEIAEVVWQMYRGARRIGIEQLTRAVGDNLQAREESKALAMRSLHVFRRALPMLAEAAGVGGDAWSYLRIRELLSPRHAGAIGELAETRREECEAALRDAMPDELNVPLPAKNGAGPARLPDRPRPQRTPIGVSPGVVSGVVTTLEQATANGGGNGGGNGDERAILVCESADACIQTLLPGSAGLITLRGSMLSHISTLAREYGIPAVVNHPLAATLKDGQLIVMNGNTGEVEVIA